MKRTQPVRAGAQAYGTFFALYGTILLCVATFAPAPLGMAIGRHWIVAAAFAITPGWTFPSQPWYVKIASALYSVVLGVVLFQIQNPVPKLPGPDADLPTKWLCAALLALVLVAGLARALVRLAVDPAFDPLSDAIDDIDAKK